MANGEVMERWPHIRRFLRVEPSGRVEAVFPRWQLATLSAAEQAVAYEEWADFYEWRLQQRATELAGDPVKHHLVAAWTDSMVYVSRRLAASARGEDPGEWVPQYQRRPDLDRCGAVAEHGTQD